MDAELVQALAGSPENVTKVPADGTNVFWGDPVAGPAVMKAERTERVVSVEVFGYE